MRYKNGGVLREPCCTVNTAKQRYEDTNEYKQLVAHQQEMLEIAKINALGYSSDDGGGVDDFEVIKTSRSNWWNHVSSSAFVSDPTSFGTIELKRSRSTPRHTEKVDKSIVWFSQIDFKHLRDYDIGLRVKRVPHVEHEWFYYPQISRTIGDAVEWLYIEHPVKNFTAIVTPSTRFCDSQKGAIDFITNIVLPDFNVGVGEGVKTPDSKSLRSRCSKRQHEIVKKNIHEQTPRKPMNPRPPKQPTKEESCYIKVHHKIIDAEKQGKIEDVLRLNNHLLDIHLDYDSNKRRTHKRTFKCECVYCNEFKFK